MLRLTIYENGILTKIREIKPEKTTYRKLANSIDISRLTARALHEQISISVDIDFIGD